MHTVSSSTKHSPKQDKRHHQPTAYKGLKLAGGLSLVTGFALVSMEMYDKTPSRAARRLWQSYGVRDDDTTIPMINI